MSEHRAQTDCKVNGERDIRTQDEWFILSVLTLCFVGNQGKISNKLNVQCFYSESWQIYPDQYIVYCILS